MDLVGFDAKLEDEWMEALNLFLGINWLPQNLVLAIEMMQTCQHPDAQWFYAFLSPHFLKLCKIGTGVCRPCTRARLMHDYPTDRRAIYICAFMDTKYIVASRASESFCHFQIDAMDGRFDCYRSHEDENDAQVSYGESMALLHESSDLGYPPAMGLRLLLEAKKITLTTTTTTPPTLTAAMTGNIHGLFVHGVKCGNFNVGGGVEMIYQAAMRGHPEACRRVSRHYGGDDYRLFNWLKFSAFVKNGGGARAFIDWTLHHYQVFNTQGGTAETGFSSVLFQIGEILNLKQRIYYAKECQYTSSDDEHHYVAVKVDVFHIADFDDAFERVFQLDLDQDNIIIGGVQISTDRIIDVIRKVIKCYKHWNTCVRYGIREWLLVSNRFGRALINNDIRKKIARMISNDRVHWKPDSVVPTTKRRVKKKIKIDAD
jgi:hypothetical protein